MTEKKFHYSDICRGRYLCLDHGGFCDGADNYNPACPVCVGEGREKVTWKENRVDRVLHLVNGLQKRSQRNASLVTFLIGGVGALSLLGKMNGGAGSEIVSSLKFAPLFLQLGLAALVMSVAFYSLSMAHIKIAQQGKIEKKSVQDWCAALETKLDQLEKFHYRAAVGFFIAVCMFFAALVFPLVSLLIEICL